MSTLSLLLALGLTGCSGPTGPEGTEGEQGVQGEAGEPGEPGSPGASGEDGTSCTVVSNGDGTKNIVCDDGTQVTVADGEAGEAGEPGEPGAPGTSCTVADNGDGTKDIVCDDGTQVTVGDGSQGEAGAPGEAGSSCTAVDNGDGTKTISCDDGTEVVVSDGQDGEDGQDGQDGQNGEGGEGGEGGGIEVLDLHGLEMLLSTGEYAEGKSFVTATITGAEAAEDGTVSVDFTVEEADGSPVLGLPSVYFTIVKLAPPDTGESFNKWVPYIYGSETIVAGNWPNPAGTTAYRGNRENAGELTDNGDGSYHYVSATNIANVEVDGTPIAYDRSLTHRVSIMMGGHAGATADANYDFVPQGSPVAETRNIVGTATCKSCHGPLFDGHGGDRLTMENCVTCHTQGGYDANGGESIDMKVMIHKIHAGYELPSIPGADGIVFDNPATPVDESADNGEYAIWGHRDSKHSWEKAAFPAVIENCTMCHQGEVEDVDNWKTKPSREACGSCHDDVDFANGVNHMVQANDSGCAGCHPASGGGLAVTEAHDWTIRDERNIPEFTVDLAVSQPANGTHFVAGEAPVVTVVIREDGAPIDHNAVVQDDDGAEGCLADDCPAKDGKFNSCYLFVHGPRAKRNPVLTTASYAAIMSDGPGPFDISAPGAALDLIVDGGKEIFTFDSSGGDKRLSGTISAAVEDGTFANPAAATAQEMADWLNGTPAFAGRAIASVEGGIVLLRSRNLGDFFSLKLEAGEVNSQVFGGDEEVKIPGGYYPRAVLYKHTDPAEDDPKVSWSAGSITYALDSVDDLQPGTYVASVEISDRGRVSGDNYKTPTVGKVTFQVGQADEELPIARACDSCHQGPDGKGFVLDFARHNKQFDDMAVDQCGACHDYQNGHATGDWYGGHPISKRVHAIHVGSSLNYPNTTVAYTDTVPGRNWDITFPQDIHNCESCHPAGQTSGTWASKASRLSCGGCHDADEATSHMQLQTWDPSPLDPWSGDEEESCQACH